MKTTALLVLLALAMPLTLCYPEHRADFEEVREGVLKFVRGDDQDEGNGENSESTTAGQVPQVPGEEQLSIQEADCATDVYVMAFTSTDKNSGSDDLPTLEIYLADGTIGRTVFADNRGEDQQKGKGDFWRFTLSNLGLQNKCVTKDVINQIRVQNGGKDGWKINSIITILRSGWYYTVATADIDLNTFLDGNGSVKTISLTKTA